MNSLFDNAVQSIQLGIEDFQSNDPRRPLSAVRNYYSGVLLLAKELLLRTAPNADPKVVLGARLKPVLTGEGSIDVIADGTATVDFTNIARRFKDFGLQISQEPLRELNKVRTDIEHYYTVHSHDHVRAVIAQSFRVVQELFQQLDASPGEHLGDAWLVMLEVRDVYAAELEACRKTYDDIDWPTGIPDNLDQRCPECGSKLVMQVEPNNKDHQLVDSTCRVCRCSIDAVQLIETGLKTAFAAESYTSMTDGEPQPVHCCPYCSVTAYLVTIEHAGCVWCEDALGECVRCSADLNPENVAWDNTDLCGYCDNVLSKDD